MRRHGRRNISSDDDSSSDYETNSPTHTATPRDSNSDNCTEETDENGKALKLISFERTDDLEETLVLKLNENVLEMVLATSKGLPISIIGIVGKKRSGKSLLMNYIKNRLVALEDDDDDKNWLNQNKTLLGFEWEHGYQQTTTGIWIWSRAFHVEADGKKVAVLLLDSQGLHDLTPPDAYFAVFGLSILLSSTTIINLVNDIPDEIIDSLSVFLKHGNLLVKQSNSEPFQKLSFLIRDWTRLSEYSWGTSTGGKFLSKILTDNQKDLKKLKKCWEEVECCLLPCIGTKASQRTFFGNPHDLDKEFAKFLVTYINNLVGDTLTTKRFWGNEVASRDLKTFVKEYVKLFNNPGVQFGAKPEDFMMCEIMASKEIKVHQALQAYRDVFTDRVKISSNGFLKDEIIDEMHGDAQTLALQAFRKFKIPTEEEKRMEGNLEEILENEREKLKHENERTRKSKIVQSIGKACTSLRSLLNENFPFTPEPGSNLPNDLVFYDYGYLKQTAMEVMAHVEQEFLDEFGIDDVEEIEKLTELVNSVLAPIAEDITAKNDKNQQNAENQAEKAKTDLLAEYTNYMQKKIKRLPEMDATTLLLLHEDKLYDIQERFQKLNLGTPICQKKWLNDLVEEIGVEHEVMEMELEATMAQAMQMVKNEVENYEQILRQKSQDIEDENDLREFHQHYVENVVKIFKLTSPLSSKSPKADVPLQKLVNQLETMFITVVGDAILQKRRMEERMQNEIFLALEKFKDSIENHISDSDFLEEAEWKNLMDRIKPNVVVLYETNTHDIKLDPQILKRGQQTLIEKLKSLENDLIAENDQQKLAAVTKADVIFAEILGKYKGKMGEAILNNDALEQLQTEHTRLIKVIESEYLELFPCKNKPFLKTQIENLIAAATKEFTKAETAFKRLKQIADTELKSALLIVMADYTSNMNTHFGNKKGYFTKNDLDILHKDTKQAAMNKIPKDSKVTKAQINEIKRRVDDAFKVYQERNELIFNSFENQEPAIGIDLGTTYCCVAVYLHGKIQTVRTESSGEIIPSYVQFKDDGTKVFGQPAKELAYESPETTIFDAKRIIGRRWDDNNLQSDMKYWPFTVVSGEEGPQVKVNNKNMYAEEISALLLEHLKKAAEENLGKKFKRAVITVPAYFSDAQRQATVRAGELAGFKVLGILNEPSAAALAYRENYCPTEQKRNVLVFDLGGGTFDVAILEMSKNEVNVLSIGGDDHLGGEDFDKNLMKYCADEFKRETKIDLFANKDSSNMIDRNECRSRLRRLQTMCEDAKKTLSSTRGKTLSVAAFVGNTNLQVELTRKKFEEINMPLFQKTLAIVDETIKSAKLNKKNIDEIVLVGGSTRIPKLQLMLTEHFNGKALSKKIDPDQAVAHGAAVQAAILSARPGVKLFDFGRIQEVTPHSLGIEMANKKFDVIIPKNTKIPTTLQQVYETHRDNQESAWIRVFQGENTEAKENKLLGDFVLDGIPKNKAGLERVQVSMHINLNGILNVEGLCKSTNGTKKITVSQDKGIMSEETKQRLLAERNPGTSR